jgi:hypothetical protein
LLTDFLFTVPYAEILNQFRSALGFAHGSFFCVGILFFVSLPLHSRGAAFDVDAHFVALFFGDDTLGIQRVIVISQPELLKNGLVLSLCRDYFV